MRTIKNNWKVALIVAVGIIAIILLGVFCIQSSQNRAFTLEEQVILLILTQSSGKTTCRFGLQPC